jgi:hypothetical protein
MIWDDTGCNHELIISLEILKDYAAAVEIARN